MQIFLTALSQNGQRFSKPRVVTVQDAQLRVSPGKNGLTKADEYIDGVIRNSYLVYESPAEIQAQSQVAIGQAAGIFAKNHVATGLAALGANQGAALGLTKQLNEVSSGTTGTADGVRLPAATVGKSIAIINSCAFALDLWPATGEKIDAAAVNAQSTIAIGARVHLVCVDTAGTWITAVDYTQI